MSASEKVDSLSKCFIVWLLVLVDLTFAIGTKNVSIINGTVVGYRVTTADNLTAWQFHGIPFAKPPVNKLRFERPQSITKRWSDPLYARQSAPACRQPNPRNQSEDCLYLSIWTPLNVSTPRPVMVWIHGGSYELGSVMPWYDGRALAAYGDVVVVVIQYRLGIFGFLRLDDQISPGNLGLFDQQLALQWVNENIEAFGGDSSSITIFGESAGASSVALHLLNEDSSKLFHRVIIQSGSPLNHWAYHPQGSAPASLCKLLLTDYVGCPKNSSSFDLLSCAKSKTASELMRAQSELSSRQWPLWFPVFDGSFLLRDVYEMIKTAQLPKKDVMIGVTSAESSASLVNSLPSALDTPEKIQRVINSRFRYFPRYPELNKMPALTVIQQLLTSGEEPSNGEYNARRIGAALGDFDINCGVNTLADALKAVNSSVYYYIFDYIASYNSPRPAWVGAAHFEEIPFMFGSPFVPNYNLYNFTAKDKQISMAMVADWTNFARTGKPNAANWLKFNSDKSHFFRIATQSSLEEYGYRREQCSLWDDIVPLMNTQKENDDIEKTYSDDLYTTSTNANIAISCPIVSDVTIVSICVMAVYMGALTFLIIYFWRLGSENSKKKIELFQMTTFN